MNEKARQDKNVELGKGAWHVLTSIPYIGDLFNLSDYMLDAIYQTIKGIEENLAKLMKSSDLEYASHNVYPSPIFNYPDEDTIESAHYDAKEFYEENKKEFNDVDKMINSLEVKTTIEGEEYGYKEIFKKDLRHYFENDNDRIIKEAEREKKERRERRERDSKSREIEIEAFEDRFTPDAVERDPDHEQIKWDEKYHPLLEANENFFKGFLEGIKDIQKDEKSFNDKNLKEALSDATKKTRLSNTKFREGYLYAVNRNKLNPERLKGKYADGRIEGVNIEQVEEVLRSIEEERRESSALETQAEPPPEHKDKQDDISVLKKDINTIKDSLKNMNDFINELKKDKEEDKTTDDLTMEDGDIQPTSLLAEQTNVVVEEVRAGFENILNTFATQTGVDPASGEERILTVSLTDENANNISTLIVEKLNEEEAIEPIEKTAEGVSNEELGIEVRDSKRSLKGEIADLKSKLDFLIKLIGKKAMTFDDIYKMVFRRLAREHEMQTGRRVGY